jgi:hypothetical protein
LVGQLLTAALPGCVTTQGQALHWPWAERPAKGEVTQVMALWADGVDVQPDPARGGVPTPGLAGRIFLFGKAMEGLEAEGTMTIYLYDDAQPPSDKPVPREMWNLDPVSLQRVLKKDGLGWGYTLWLPWSSYRPEVRKVTLVAHYRTLQGRDVWSGAMSLTVSDGTGPKLPSQLQTQAQTTPRYQHSVTAIQDPALDNRRAASPFQPTQVR